MISKVDIERYLKEAGAIEREMAKNYDFLATTLTHPYYKERFRRLFKQETRHGRLLDEIKSLLDA
ncbi:MAG: hypothetical protein SWH61_02210 [Thermodesulfobacteriota bacterium]|nr:hypothetical protein [Thermodesulfobacteriota bacterium]